MRTTFSLSFYCRESKANKAGLAPLECGVNVNGTRVFVNLPQKFSPNEFNRKRQPDYVQDAISLWRQIGNEAINGILAQGQPLTAANLKDVMQSGGVKSLTLSRLWDKYLEVVRKKVGVSITDGVYRKYELVKDKTIEIMGDKEATAIIPSDIENFELTLRREYKQSTLGGFLTKIRTLFRWAQRNGLIKTDPTNGLRISKGEPKQEYLTEEELDKMYRTDLSLAPRLERVRDVLLFQAYGGGMSYVDMCHFNAEKMVEVNGYMTYSGKRQKTGTAFTTILLPRALEILERYDYKMPYISNQKLNAYAKDVAVYCGIDKNLTSHLFRKSYATMLLAHHIPVTTISKCMGHTSPIITAKIYAIAQTECMVSEFAKAF